ncbi:hypothetical protein M5689_007390 [Euphorbia peplus]|nr:hypothetical protein M5689_007390 [Euphorbia peplus]
MAMVVLMAVLAVSLDVCWCSMPDHNIHDSDSWSAWFHGVDNENVMESAGNTAAKTKDTVQSAASEASNKAYERASDLKDAASDKADQVIKMVAENEGGETFEKAKNYGKQKVDDAYDATKETVNTVKEKAFEAKDRMADALSGGVGSPVDSYDLHADWPSDDEDEQVENGRIKGCDHLTERIARKTAEVSGSGKDFIDGMGDDKFRRAADKAEGIIGKAKDETKDKFPRASDKVKHGHEKFTHMKDDKFHRASDKEHGHKKSSHFKGETKDKFRSASDKNEGIIGDGKRA